MKVGIYDPYLHILGGAERYILSIAACFADKAEITLYGNDPDILARAEKKFGFSPKKYLIKAWPATRGLRARELRKLDCFFYVTDGSLFLSPAKKNVLIIQTPAHIPVKTLSNRIKLFSWRRIICYSQFMAAIISKRLGRDADALFVPIKNPAVHTTAKQNIIVSVGRFFAHLHNKKQLEMVGFFKKALTALPKQTELHLVGSVDPGGEAYLGDVKKAAAGLPVFIHTAFSYEQLTALYQKAGVYWHAAGYGEDLEKYPEKAEHFGVVTLEAMSFGAVPVVFAGGGQKEIVTSEENGYTWQTPEELEHYTRELLTREKLRKELSTAAQKTARQYSQPAFCQRLYEIIER